MSEIPHLRLQSHQELQLRCDIVEFGRAVARCNAECFYLHSGDSPVTPLYMGVPRNYSFL